MPRFDNPTAFDRDPQNQMLQERRWWRSRIAPIDRREDLRSIVQLATRLLTRRIAGRSIGVDVEASLQLQLASILQGIGQLYVFAFDDSFVVQLEGIIPVQESTQKSGTESPRVDILLALGSGQFFATCAIEIKFFKRCNGRQHLNRYDAYADLASLESYRKKYIDETYLFVVTDDPDYMEKRPTGAAEDFSLAAGCRTQVDTPLVYRGRKRSPPAITLAWIFAGRKDLTIWREGVRK